jgi:hypothetical protein
MSTKTQTKIQYLRNLIDHERTPEEERDTARRMLQRLLDKAKEAGVTITPAGWVDPRSYGEKYDQVRNLRLTDIAKLMRQDIKLARQLGKQQPEPGAVAVMDALGTMPAQIKISVTTQYYAGGGAIDIRVKNIPADWGYVEEADRWGHMRTVPSPALRAVLDDLEAIHWSYNYDGSDAMTDHFDRRFWGGVEYERPYDR